MPFPLAHPAAVLPLRRFCPRRFSFPALVVGSLVADASYLFPKGLVDEFAHTWAGLVGFALPAGAMVLALLYTLRSRLFQVAPGPFKPAMAPVCLGPASPLPIVFLSLLVGGATHLVWDSFTHKEGWLVGQLPLLKFPLLTVGDRTARVCHGLWYLSTFGGLVCLMMAGLRRLQSADRSRSPAGFRSRLGRALLFATLLIPLAALHHLIRSLWVDLLLLVFGAFLGLAFASGLAKPASQGAGQSPREGNSSPSPATPHESV